MGHVHRTEARGGAGHSRSILLVESSPSDARLLREVFRVARVPYELMVAYDLSGALMFLREDRAHPAAGSPDLILLEMALPRDEGVLLLRALRRDPRLRGIPVALLVSCPEEAALLSRGSRIESHCIVRPTEVGQFVPFVRALERIRGLRAASREVLAG